MSQKTLQASINKLLVLPSSTTQFLSDVVDTFVEQTEAGMSVASAGGVG
jgi:hypothetical protein